MLMLCVMFFFFFSSRRRHTRCSRDWSSDVCSSDLRRRRGRGGWGDADLHTLRNRTDRGDGRDELLSGWLRKKEPSGLLGSLGCVVVRESTQVLDRKSTRLNSSHGYISYAVFFLKKKKNKKY